MSSRRLEDVFSIKNFCLPKRLEDVLEDKKLLCWRSIEDIFKTCLEDQQIFGGILLCIYHYLSLFNIYHYVLLKDLSRLVSSQYNNHRDKTYFCQYCLHDCTSEEVLENNLERCKLHGASRIKFQEADNKKGCEKVK